MTTTVTVTVAVNHSTSRPHTVWITPVGWEPDLSLIESLSEEEITWDGAAWDSNGEIAGIACLVGDLDGAIEGEEVDVPLDSLFWLSSGDCRNLGAVEID